MHYMHVQWPQSASIKDDFSVVKCCTILLWNLFWKKKRVTGSGIALQCGFRVAQAKMAREERQQQESQTRVANLGTFLLDRNSFHIFGDFSSLKEVLTNPATCDVKACPPVHDLNEQRGQLRAPPPPVLKRLWQSVSLCSSAAIPAAAQHYGVENEPRARKTHWVWYSNF